ncbi:peroxiredoxin-2E-2, chloroplastic-like [Lolium rigidum]|uniref:peroxiredoxin-2E-2, chloroplastic-like n=1 Tax=Lolium rigidum TaxID=89674 RepID=UPI001F5DFC4F|nr:peroxiredoxin-2E-2, chloroplastic-like [Lolium rigidum]
MPPQRDRRQEPAVPRCGGTLAKQLRRQPASVVAGHGAPPSGGRLTWTCRPIPWWKAGELRAKGVDTVACVSVNDAFVVKARKESLGLGDDVLLLSDGNLELTRALGVEMDLSDKPMGLGVRSRRHALLADDGVVKVLNLEEGGAFTTSSAEDMLNAL